MKFLNCRFAQIYRIARIIDAGVVKLYCLWLSNRYVHACVGCPDPMCLKSASSATIRHSDKTGNPRPPR
jgi:hypothetical protein